MERNRGIVGAGLAPALPGWALAPALLAAMPPFMGGGEPSGEKEMTMCLQVSTKGEYCVRIMVDLARHYGGRPRSLTDIWMSELLPLAYLEQLAKLLREAEPPLVTSTRRAHGGYQLSRRPQNITMREILRILEGPIAPMVCATEGEMTEICGFLGSLKPKQLRAQLR